MFSLVFSFFKWLLSLWEKLPDSLKKEIIDLIVKEFTQVFRNYYRHWRKNKNI
jgi:hypothetical protein